MSRATGVSGVWLGAALLLAFSTTNASAAPHTPRPERVSTAADGSQADGSSMSAAISADGRRVAFTSTAPSFGCGPFTPCLLVKDLPTGEVTRIDVGSGNTYGYPLPSADGSRVAFSAGTRFTAPYLYDRTTGSSERLWPENPPGFNELGRVQSISPDGTHVAYTIGNRHGSDNFPLLYVRDTVTGTDELISPAEEGDKAGASVSGDGERVAYGVRVDSETDPVDVFVFSGALRRSPAPMPSVTERISLRSDGQQWSGASHDPAMGEDKVVAFTSQGLTDPDDTNVLVNAAGGLAQVNSTAQGPAHEGTSCDSGRMVGHTAPLDSDGGPGLHIRNRPVGKLTGLGSYQGVRFAWMGQLSVDRTCQWMSHTATLPATDADPDPQPRVYRYRFQQGRNSCVRDLDTGMTTKVAGTEPSLSGTGTHLAYTSGRSAYLLELATGKRQLVSVYRWGGRNDLPARNPSVNADGTVVAFESASSDLVKGDTNEVSDVFLRTVQ